MGVGYAVKDRTGEIRTASDTRERAMANGLVLLCGCDPFDVDRSIPAEIERAWYRTAGGRMVVEVALVEVVPA